MIYIQESHADCSVVLRVSPAANAEAPDEPILLPVSQVYFVIVFVYLPFDLPRTALRVSAHNHPHFRDPASCMTAFDSPFIEIAVMLVFARRSASSAFPAAESIPFPALTRTAA
jgi:hypothetical protein